LCCPIAAAADGDGDELLLLAARLEDAARVGYHIGVMPTVSHRVAWRLVTGRSMAASNAVMLPGALWAVAADGARHQFDGPL